MRFFCPACWEDIPASAAWCPCCGAALAEMDRETFAVKVRRALHHPEPQTAVRAAWILGERQDLEAVPDLVRALESSPDPFLAEAAAEALGKIGDTIALPALSRACATAPLRVRRAAARAIQCITGDRV